MSDQPSIDAIGLRGGDPSHQLTVLAVAGALWCWWPAASFVALLVAYLAAALLINSAFVLWGPRFTLDRLPRRWAIAATLVALSAPASMLLRELPRLMWYEQLTMLQENLPDRLVLEQSNAVVFPRSLRSDRPQRLFVHAVGASEVQAEWEGLKHALSCTDLGHGLFQLHYRPHLHGASDDLEADSIEVRLSIDGHIVTDRLCWVAPQPHPRWFASNPTLSMAATVSQETDQLIVVHQNGSARVFGVDDGPVDCAWVGQQQIVVAHRHSHNLTIIDLGDSSQRTLPNVAGRWTRLAVSPDGVWLAAGRDAESGQVVLLSVSAVRNAEATSPIAVDLPDAPDWLCFSGDSKRLLVSCRQSKTLLRLSSRAETSPAPWSLDSQTLALPRPVTAMGRAANGAICLATTTDALDSDDLQGNHLISHSIHLLDVESWRIRRTLRTDRRSQRQDQPGGADRGGSPMGFCAAEDGRLLIAMAGTHEVWRLSLEDDSLDVVDLPVPGLSNPHGVGRLGKGRWCVSSPTDASIAVFTADGQPVARIGLVDRPLSETQLWRRRGERTFYETTRSGISCQSCHLHGDSDFSRHNIGQGHLSATLSTAGVAGTAPYLRDASNSRLRDLHDLATGHYRGYRRDVPWDRGHALASYLRDLPSRRFVSANNDQARRRRGVDAMVKADCIRCHAFPAFSNLGLHYTAMLFPEQARQWRAESPRVHLLDTPSLIGVGDSAPYLHDGRAATLSEVLRDHNTSNRHGNVRSLTPQEQEDLIFFLKSL